MEREMEMENEAPEWRMKGNKEVCAASELTVRGILDRVRSNLDPHDTRPVIPIGSGNPALFNSFRTTPVAEDAVVDAIRSAAFNGYSNTVGILPARKAIADYLSRDLPFALSPDDVYLTPGANQSIEIAISALASPGANILLPRPGYPLYEAWALYRKLEVRHFDLLPERGWEVDLRAVEALADNNTVAISIINPGNPCGNVYTYEHLQKVAETARKLGILVISDEVYHHLAFGSNSFVPMGTFGSTAPVLCIGSISKRWIVPGWRLGWIVTVDPCHILKKYGIVDCIKGYANMSADASTLIQGALPQILERTKDDFFSRILELLRKDVNLCWEKFKDISCISCPYKPQGGMFIMVKLDPQLLDDIEDDTDFCHKIAKEESVVILPGNAVGMRNWLRITFATEPTMLEEAFERIKIFCQRHANEC